MRVKAGSEWSAPAPGKPILVELTAEDKEFIRWMAPEATMYAVFDEDEPMTAAERREWMWAGRTA